jgi:pimeloyl-ACP methyl ester carboxylesterase
MSMNTSWSDAARRRRARHVRMTLVLLAAFLQAPGAGAQEAEAVQVEAQTPIPLAEWDDDWWYPEGRIRILGQRYSLFAGSIVTAFITPSTRDRFGARLIDPNVTLYRPARIGTSFDVDFAWIGLTKQGQKARYIAATAGLRRTFVDSTRQRLVVPFGVLRVGPYFARTAQHGGRTVVGANATFGMHLARRLSVAVRYDRLQAVNAVNLSTMAVDVAVKVPIGAPRGAAAKMRDYVPPPGRMIDVGGHRLHLVCLGEGTPAVVLESGLSDAWISWSKVQPELAKTTRVCAYDRAGIGYSEPGPIPRTSERIAGELRTVLQRAGIAPPYVLVGHSFGGLNVRMFAARYPGEVAGMVLVDSSHEEQWSRGGPELRRQAEDALERLHRRASRARAGEPAGTIAPNLPVAVASRPAWHRALYEELRSLPESSRQVRATARPLDVPLVVVTAGRTEWTGLSRRARAGMRTLWSELQASLARLSPQGTQVIATTSGHNVQREAPHIVIDAVRQVLARQEKHND